MAQKVNFVGKNFAEELASTVNDELLSFLKQKDPTFEWPAAKKTQSVSHGDFTVVLSAVCGKKRINANDFTKDTAAFLTKVIVCTPLHCNTDLWFFQETAPNRSELLLQKVEAAGGYLNIWISKPVVSSKVIKVSSNRQVEFRVFTSILTQGALNLGKLYGTLDVMRGKKVIVEHTSANPIGPLHIGNLRNVILGGVLSQILKVRNDTAAATNKTINMKHNNNYINLHNYEGLSCYFCYFMQCVGYEVKQHFYVNDLGFQIGLTAIGFVR